jgi:hypothetical protein
MDTRAVASPLLVLLYLANGTVLAATASAASGATRAASVAAVKIASAPALDGNINVPPWTSALAVDAFIDVTTKTTAALATHARMLYDATHLYIAFSCDQTNVSSSQNVSDVIAGVDDSVAIDLDPTGVGARTYTFAATPNGLKYQTSSESAIYLPRWTAVGVKTATGYSVEMAIPLDVLRADSGIGRHWRMNFRRHLRASNDDYSWAYDPKAGSYADPTTWPEITSIDLAPGATRPPAHASLYALASAGGASHRFQDAFGNFVAETPRIAGIDATVPFTNTTSLVATLNPDFSNIERDQTTIVPQQFRRNLAEYRPFFVQGAQYVSPLPVLGVFANADLAFYSPAIGTFDRGAKIEGTQGLNSFGALNVQGANFDDEAYGYQYARPDNTFAAVFEGVSAHHTGIFDQTTGVGFYRRNVHSGEFTLFSHLQNRGTLVTSPSDGNSFNIAEGLTTQKLSAFVLYRADGAQFAPLDGYTAVNDVAGPEAVFAYNGTGGAKGIVKSYTISLATDRLRNHHGDVALSDALASASFTTKNLIGASLSTQASEQRTYDVAYPTYTGPHDVRFDQTTLSLGYRDGTPTPTDASYAFGPFAIPARTSGVLQQSYVQQSSLATSARVGRTYTIGVSYAGVRERSLLDGASDGQALRTLTVARGLGVDSTFSLALRSISGNGGFAAPGTNVSAGIHLRFRNLDELYVNFGSPASPTTLNRFLIKYVLNLGGGSGV